MSGVDWPILEYAIAWTSGPADDPSPDRWCSITDRTEGTTTVTRGKEYELDQVQPGEMEFTLRNDDGAFDPSNASSPFYPQVLSYRLCRLRAQYPPTPANQLLPDQATGLYSSLGAVTTSKLPQWITVGFPSMPLSIAPFDGTSNKYLIPAGSATTSNLFTVGGFAAQPGVTYSAQAQFSCVASVAMAVVIDWYGLIDNPMSSTVGSFVTSTTGQLTVTGTAPAGTLSARFRVITGGTPSAVSVYKLGWEASGTPSAWTTPGTWYSMFTGYIERWPQSWDASGSYGTVDVTAVDRFTWLANRGLNPAGFLEVLSLIPWRFCPLNEESGSRSFADYLGLRADALIYTPRSGVYQTIAPGNALEADSGALPPAGIEGPVVTFTNQPSQTVAQLIDMTGGGQTTGFGVGSTSQWTRVFAFRTPRTPALAGVGGSLMRAYQNDQYLDAYISVGGSYDVSGNYTNLSAIVVGNGGTAASSTPSAANLSDGSWHLVAIAIDNIGDTMSLWLDGQPQPVTNSSAFPTRPTGTDVLGGRLTLASKSTPGPAADFAMCADWLRILSNTEVANLWEAFQYGWGSQSPNRDESSGARYQRLLNWAGVVGAPRIDSGATVQYGPATDITSESKLLDGLQSVVDTEAGQHFIASDGQIVFASRRARVNQASTVTFGENGGEVAYLNAATDYDPTLVVNDASATAQYGEGAEATSYRVTDTPSSNAYGDLSADRTVNTLDSGELLGAAQYILYESKQPLLRLEGLPVDVGNNPAYWPTLLGLELGSAVTWKRRPPNAPAITMAAFVEQIAWSIDDQRHASWTGQLSNAALHQFGVLDDATYGLFNSTLIFGY